MKIKNRRLVKKEKKEKKQKKRIQRYTHQLDLFNSLESSGYHLGFYLFEDKNWRANDKEEEIQSIGLL